jgi:hypothetical protein
MIINIDHPGRQMATSGRWLAGLIAISAWGSALMGAPARADFKIHEPIVVPGELEIEAYADRSFDHRPDKNSAQNNNYELAYGVTDWWKPELEAELHRDPGGKLRYDATTFENIFQPFEQGEYWLDLGFFAEFSRSQRHTDPDAATFGPLLQKQVGHTLHTLNLLLTRQIGDSAKTGAVFDYAWQSKWLWKPEVAPGVEIFGEPGRLGHFGSISDQQHRIGPIVTGAVLLPQVGKLKYEVGYLFGVTNAAERGVAKLQLEYELFF